MASKTRQLRFLKSLPVILLFLLVCCFAGGLPVLAENPQGHPTGKIQDNLQQTVKESFQKALTAEKNKLGNLTRRISNTGSLETELDTVYKRYQAMVSTQSSLLLMPSVDLRTLDQAHTQQQVALGNIEDRLADFRGKIKSLKDLLSENQEQISFYRERLATLEAKPTPSAADAEVTARLKTLIDVLSDKQKKIETLTGFYENWESKFQTVQTDIRALSRKFETQIGQREKSRILHHNPSPLIRIVKGELRADLREAAEQTHYMLSQRFWAKPGQVGWDAYGTFLILFLFLFCMTEALLYFISRYFERLRRICLARENFWQALFLRLLRHTLLIGGAMAFFHFYPVRSMYRLTPFFVLFPLIIRLLGLLLVVQWLHIFVRTWKKALQDPLLQRVYPHLRQFLIGVFVFGSGYFVITQLYCADCLLVIAWRLLFELILLGWAAVFFRKFWFASPESPLSGQQWFVYARPVFVLAGYLLVIVGLLAELTGFGGLAGYWFMSLAGMVVVFFWAIILFRVLQDFDVVPASDLDSWETEDQTEEERSYPVRWLLVRLSRLVIIAGVIFALPLAWGAERTFLADIFYAVNYRVTIGQIELSVMGLVYAVIVLLVVHTISVIWQDVLRFRILGESKLETGLKDSIVRISVYGIWGVGILIALSVIGISGTSLTVVFGAVGIGLGFGLQTIFSNFMSGIILLFERPIQVGDVIEIEGIWCTVKEINVRATHVKTFDNADLIIPNADFISQRVTNWSFRDARVRRSITIRVAYGSDIERVRETLFDIVYKHPRVLRRPHPEVLFTDFGDSALVFEVRFWVHLDYFLTVETDIRFDIDKQFREQNIRIPFPQRDIYIQESPGLNPAVEKREGPEVPGEGISS
ncbi:MAG: mechanosensitive ion channel domain-containing protein [Thermodesulfobacteriota bacterium]